jgi:hypothetical protein
MVGKINSIFEFSVERSHESSPLAGVGCGIFTTYSYRSMQAFETVTNIVVEVE